MMNDDELHESFYRSEQYKESDTEKIARLMAEADLNDGDNAVVIRDGIAYRGGKPFGITAERALRPKPEA